MVACVFMLTLGLPLTAESQPERVLFIPLATPCRAFDSRLTGGPIPADVQTPIKITGITAGPGGNCGVPDTAVGAALNFTITGAQGAGHLTVWSSGPLPLTSAVNFTPGEDAANAVDIGLAANGTVLVQSLATTDLVVDIYGYFTGGELAGSNTALGDSACSITTGSNNTCLGASALLNNTTGSRNTATGALALQSNTTGSDNTAMGFNALVTNTFTNRNTAIGTGALQFNNAGDDNTAIGFSALSANTAGVANIAIGSGAGALVTTGNENIHIGNPGNPADNNVIRLGRLGHTRTFIAGIFGFTPDFAAGGHVWAPRGPVLVAARQR
jgi:hypothetical protein